jgi:1-acyl-sn-glycerol-3-phosphate acyltransferase
VAGTPPDPGDEDLHERARRWRPGPTRAVVLSTVRVLVRVLFAPRVLGAERVPADGAVLLVANHRSLSDGLFQAVASPRALRWMGMAELFRSPLRARLILALGAFPVRRGSGDAHAIDTARELLEQGQAVAIYPEGRLHFRSPEPVGEPHSGAGRLALQTGARLVPMGMVGTDRLLAAALLRGRHRIRISFGETIQVPEESRASFLGGDREAAKRLVTERVWPQVRAQVQTLRDRPAVAAAGGGGTLILLAGLLLRRRRRHARAAQRRRQGSSGH